MDLCRGIELLSACINSESQLVPGLPQLVLSVDDLCGVRVLCLHQVVSQLLHTVEALGAGIDTQLELIEALLDGL